MYIRVLVWYEMENYKLIIIYIDIILIFIVLRIII